MAVVLCQLVFVAVSAPSLIGACIVALLVFCYATRLADISIRELRRIAINAVSPIMSSVNELKNGTPIIRAMRLQPFFTRRQSLHVEEWTRKNYYVRALQAWLGHVGSFLAFIFGTTTTFVLLGTRDERSAEQVRDGHLPRPRGPSLTFA